RSVGERRAQRAVVAERETADGGAEVDRPARAAVRETDGDDAVPARADEQVAGAQQPVEARLRLPELLAVGGEADDARADGRDRVVEARGVAVGGPADVARRRVEDAQAAAAAEDAQAAVGRGDGVADLRSEARAPSGPLEPSRAGRPVAAALRVDG